MMSKGQQKSNKEIRKPKKDKKSAAPVVEAGNAVKQLDTKGAKKK